MRKTIKVIFEKLQPTETPGLLNADRLKVEAQDGILVGVERLIGTIFKKELNDGKIDQRPDFLKFGASHFNIYDWPTRFHQFATVTKTWRSHDGENWQLTIEDWDCRIIGNQNQHPMKTEILKTSDNPFNGGSIPIEFEDEIDEFIAFEAAASKAEKQREARLHAEARAKCGL